MCGMAQETSLVRKNPAKRSAEDAPLPSPKTPRIDDDPAFSLAFLFRGKHGRYLPPFVVSHSPPYQEQLDRLQIARGVQWEIARGIRSGRWGWADLHTKIDQLRGSNAHVAPNVASILLGTPMPPPTAAEISLWEELDREAKAFVEGKSRGLGLRGPFEGVPDYYGGKIQCTIRLLQTEDDAEPKVMLERLQMTRSTHLARELGSLSVIALKDNKGGTVVRKWATHKFVLCGRVYVALPPNGGKVYLIETNETYNRVAAKWCGDQNRISYDDYIGLNNPMNLNAQQASARTAPFAKYLARLNLYLSTSIPVLEFTVDCIHFIDDEYAYGWSEASGTPAEKIMTDGCGFINRAAALRISIQLGYSRVPVAFQGRIAGSKGLWILHTGDTSHKPRIWIRHSQRKIRFPSLRRAHRIFDLLAVSTPARSPVRLSAQSIIILANNGVSKDVLCSLQERSLKSLVAPLMDWSRPHATAYLWNAVQTLSSVTHSRIQRLATDVGRAIGVENRSYGDPVKSDGSEPGLDWSGPLPSGRNTFSGEPLTSSEAVLDLLEAGFDPRQSQFLCLKIDTIIRKTMDAFLEKYRIGVDGFSEVYIVPDPTGELREGQVFYRSSTDPETPLEKEVLVGRYPMRESSDVQKVTAVNVPDLASYVDVLVMSMQGSRSLASQLGGGDSDGDEVFIICDADVVKQFQNQPVVPVPAEFQAQNFQVKVKSVEEVGIELSQMKVPAAQCAFQQHILGGLVDDTIGRYSVYHDCAVYEYGLDDRRTRRLAHMICALLDSRKTGLNLLPAAEAADEREFNGRHPQRARCFDLRRGHSRRRPVGPFILDDLQASGNKVKDTLLHDFQFSPPFLLVKNGEDADLAEPYLHAKKWAQVQGPIPAAVNSDLRLIDNRIDHLRACYRQVLENGAPQAQQKTKKGRATMGDNPMTPLMFEYRQPIPGLQVLDRLGSLDVIKASCAHVRSPSFAFSMAFRDLCDIKSRAVMKQGPTNPVSALRDIRDLSPAAQRLVNRRPD